uniref:Uncharacterized protein n=1 Tax=Timema monikensis TaxID=170555 RepID=A0A7R9DZ49_9NEOP|nr:unnamed protein product [Timema monikensis]
MEESDSSGKIAAVRAGSHYGNDRDIQVIRSIAMTYLPAPYGLAPATTHSTSLALFPCDVTISGAILSTSLYTLNIPGTFPCDVINGRRGQHRAGGRGGSRDNGSRVRVQAIPKFKVVAVAQINRPAGISPGVPGAFLIPFTAMLIFAGLPLMFMELSFGQYASLGPVAIYEKFCPLLSGLGYGMVAVSAIVMLYYNLIIAWTIFYMFASLCSVLPWQACEDEWSTQACCYGRRVKTSGALRVSDRGLYSVLLWQVCEDEWSTQGTVRDHGMLVNSHNFKEIVEIL